jgi:hypothetical protein
MARGHGRGEADVDSRVASSGVRATTRDPRGNERREESHHRDGENDRYQNETVRYHGHSTRRVFNRPGAPAR